MTVIEYLTGLTTFAVDEAVLQRIAQDRGADAKDNSTALSQKQKDLMLADILYTIYIGGSNIPSFAHQHGQFSTSTGSQTIGDKEALYKQMISLYRRWGDCKLCLIPQTSGLVWME